jgi:hypothetical protein
MGVFCIGELQLEKLLEKSLNFTIDIYIEKGVG